jgi:methyl-accepting chemotaxis protein
MSVHHRSVPSEGPKRSVRNLLLDKRFQLKYTGLVVIVTVTIASVLGAIAYRYSQGQTQALTIQLAQQPDLPASVASDLQAYAESQDREVLTGILLGIVFLTIAIGLTGIWITHKIVGPVHRMKRALRDLAHGPLKVEGQLRKGDELHELFRVFASTADTLRERQWSEMQCLAEVIAKAESDGASVAVVEELQALHDRMSKHV